MRLFSRSLAFLLAGGLMCGPIPLEFPSHPDKLAAVSALKKNSAPAAPKQFPARQWGGRPRIFAPVLVASILTFLGCSAAQPRPELPPQQQEVADFNIEQLINIIKKSPDRQKREAALTMLIYHLELEKLKPEDERMIDTRNIEEAIVPLLLNENDPAQRILLIRALGKAMAVWEWKESNAPFKIRYSRTFAQIMFDMEGKRNGVGFGSGFQEEAIKTVLYFLISNHTRSRSGRVVLSNAEIEEMSAAKAALRDMGARADFSLFFWTLKTAERRNDPGYVQFFTEALQRHFEGDPEAFPIPFTWDPQEDLGSLSKMYTSFVGDARYRLLALRKMTELLGRFRIPGDFFLRIDASRHLFQTLQTFLYALQEENAPLNEAALEGILAVAGTLEREFQNPNTVPNDVTVVGGTQQDANNYLQSLTRLLVKTLRENKERVEAIANDQNQGPELRNKAADVLNRVGELEKKAPRDPSDRRTGMRWPSLNQPLFGAAALPASFPLIQSVENAL